MVNIQDISMDEFYSRVQYKKWFIFGNGIRTERLLSECTDISKLEAIVDNNVSIIGKQRNMTNGDKKNIIGVSEFVQQVMKNGKDNVCMVITPVYGTADILEQLNMIEELDGLECYLSEFLFNYRVTSKIEYTKGRQKIPKKIHYCWFGKKEIPDHLKKYMESWSKICPDYTIIRWDESNYDYTKNQYMREAYESKKWGFVPDYARLDIIYNEGGIYLDTDIEIIRNLDHLLCDDVFLPFASEFSIALGAGFGAKPKHEFIKKLRDAYDTETFIKPDRTLNLNACTVYQTPIIKQEGFSLRNKFQKKDGIVLYPSEVFVPLEVISGRIGITEHTVSIHYGEFSWLPNKNRKEIEVYKQCLSGK